MKKNYLLVLSFIFSNIVFSQTIQTQPTIESIGYTVSNLSSFSTHISVSARFRVSGGTYRNAYEPGITAINGQAIIAGSLFELTPATLYDIEVTIVDSMPNLHSQVITTTAITMAEPIFAMGTDILWVSTNGSGTLYTQSNPGKFDQLFNNDYSRVKCGTTILCKGGTYYLGDLQYNTVSTNCGQGGTVTIMSAPGEHAVFDGSDSSFAATNPVWTLYDAGANIYNATLPNAVSFSTLCMIDSTRLFPYAVVYQQALGLGTYFESLSNCDNYFGPGFYRNANNFYVKLAGGANPNGKKVTVSKRHALIYIYNNNAYNMHFTFKNLEFKNYGKPTVSGSTEYSATVLDLRRLKSTIVDSCKFSYNTFSLSFSNSFDSTIIQNCEFKDVTGFWSHGAYKNSSLTEHPDINFLSDNGKYGRVLETVPVWFDSQNATSKSIIIRRNKFDGFVSAISGRGDATGYSNLVYSTDIYENNFVNNYNIVVPVGNSINFRFFRNNVSRFLVGLSLIDNAIGPVYMFRNVWDEILSRNNPANNPASYNPGSYINYNGCLGLKDKVWGTILKLNAGSTPLNQRYQLHLIHNTVYSNDSLGYNFYIWEQNWKSIKCINNSFNASYCIHNFENANNNALFQFNSISDNYYSQNGYLGAVNPSHGTMNCYNDQDLTSFLSHLQLRSGNYDTLLLNIRGYTLAPDFVSASQHNFHLNNSSPLIDRALALNNFNDLLNVNYFGNAPDIGAFENNSTVSSIKNKTITTQGFSVFPNPTAGSIIINASDKYKGSKLIIRNVLGEQINQPIILKDNNTAVSIDASSGIYFLELITTDGKIDKCKVVKE